MARCGRRCVSAGIIHAFSVSLPWRELTRLILAAAAAAAVAGYLWAGDDLLRQFVAGLLYLVVFIVTSFVFKAWRETDLAAFALAARCPRCIGRPLRAMSVWLSRWRAAALARAKASSDRSRRRRRLPPSGRPKPPRSRRR